MADEILQARRALAPGNEDEALVLLWKALEPARLAGDESTLAEIAELACSIPRAESADLVAATGVQLDAEPSATPAEAPPPVENPRPLGRMTSRLWVLVLLLALVLGAVVVSRQWPDASGARRAGSPAKVTLEADALHLVPLGRYSRSELLNVGFELIRVTGAMDVLTGAMDVLPAVGMGPQRFDAGRLQFVAEDLLGALSDAYGIGGGRTILVVGVTSSDMYARAQPGAAYAETARSTDGRYVVISAAHFAAADPDGREKRLAALVLREVRRVGFRNPATG